MTAQQIHELRQRTGMAQAKFGQLFGCSQTTVALWETGARKPPAIYKVCMGRLSIKIGTKKESKYVAETLSNFLLYGGISEFLKWLYSSKKL